MRWSHEVIPIVSQDPVALRNQLNEYGALGFELVTILDIADKQGKPSRAWVFKKFTQEIAPV